MLPALWMSALLTVQASRLWWEREQDESVKTKVVGIIPAFPFYGGVG